MAVRPLPLVVAVVVLAGCGGNDGTTTTAATTATTRATTTGTVTTTPAGLEGASTTPVAWKSDLGQSALLTGVRAALHDGYDRVVFEFRTGVPGYDVGYVERPVRADGSGEPVAVSGAAVLLVRMEPALDADLTQESAPPTYTGPARLHPATRAVAELVRTGGFEAVITWAVGVDGKRPFRVTRLDSPARIVLDVASS
jgi:hypothetical protein